ncbi:MAG: TraR/DksA family transcriptional regulator [Methanococcaceae archaeon]
MIEKNSYTKQELEEFRKIILSKMEKAREAMSLLTETYTMGNYNDINDTSPTFKLVEDGHQVLAKEMNSHFASRQEKYIKSLQDSLIRIENRTYGICRATGKLIPKERLMSVPHATLSIEAKQQRSAEIPVAVE